MVAVNIGFRQPYADTSPRVLRVQGSNWRGRSPWRSSDCASSLRGFCCPGAPLADQATCSRKAGTHHTHKCSRGAFSIPQGGADARPFGYASVLVRHCQNSGLRSCALARVH